MKTKLFLLILVCISITSRAQQFIADSSQTYFLNNLTNTSSSVTAFDDGNKGTYILWLDGRVGPNKTAIYLQHINRFGIPSFPQNGQKLITASSNSISGYKAIKTATGFFIAWNLNTSVYPDSLFCNSYSFAGNPLWLAPKLVASRDAGMISIDNNGLNIMPTDSGYFINYAIVYIGGSEGFAFNRVNTNGYLRWPKNYFQISSNGYYWTTVSDNHSGFFYAVTTGGLGAHIYAQHFNSQGVKSYASDVDISTTAGGRGNSALKVLCDNDTNLYVIWESIPTYHIKISKVKAHGGLAWTPDFRTISGAAGGRTNPSAYFFNNSIYSAWSDSRPPATNYFVYAQKTDVDGNMLWTLDGDSIFRQGAYLPYPKIIPNIANDIFISGAMSPGFMGQIKDTSGLAKWRNNGITIHVSNNGPFYDDYALIAHSDSSATEVWATNDGRVATSKISADGKLFNQNPLPSGATAIFGNDTICDGATNVTYTSATIAGASAYLWNLSPGISPSSGTTTTLTPSITVDFSLGTTSATIRMRGQNAFGNGAISPTLSISVSTTPSAAGSITGLDSAAACSLQNGFAYSINPIANASHYLWTLPPLATVIGNPDSTSIVLNYNPYSTSGNISVSGSNVCGTGAAAQLPINFKSIPVAEICLATVDSASQKTNLFWQKPVESYVNGYVIYREIAGVYSAIDTVSNALFSSYLDTGSHPQLQTETYKIAVLDSCGNTGDISAPYQHQTIRLYGSTQPGGITKLYWNDYSGITDPLRYYNILRDTLGSGPFNDTIAKNILPLPAMNKTDFSSANYPLCRYVIEMNFQSNCSPSQRLMLSKSTSRSNIRNRIAFFDSTTIGILPYQNSLNEVLVYPNPVKEKLTISNLIESLSYEMEVYNSLGKCVLLAFNDGAEKKEIDLQNLSKGLYLLKLKTKFNIKTFKIQLE